jgi:hypothetical protein
MESMVKNQSNADETAGSGKCVVVNCHSDVGITTLITTMGVSLNPVSQYRNYLRAGSLFKSF